VAFLPVQWQSVVERSKAVRASLSTGQLVSLVAVFVGVLALVIGSAWYLNRTEYRVLFSDLNGEEASKVVERLTADNVEYQLRDGGRTVLVPVDSTDTLRLQFAGEGMPTSGRIGFEIFDKGAPSRANWPARSPRCRRSSRRACTSRWRRSRSSAPRSRRPRPRSRSR
jgi:flagellar M-ring protein FliF